jgi:hypothetical protein
MTATGKEDPPVQTLSRADENGPFPPEVLLRNNRDNQGVEQHIPDVWNFK